MASTANPSTWCCSTPSLHDGVCRHTGDVALAHHQPPPPVLLRVEADPRPRPNLNPIVQDRPPDLRPTADGRPVEQDAVLHHRARVDPAVEPDYRPPEPPLGHRPVREDVVSGQAGRPPGRLGG